MVSGVLVVVVVALLWGRARSAKNRWHPSTVGASTTELAPCPATSNCVASQGAAGSRLLAPIPFAGRAADAQVRLREAIASMARGTVVADRPGYIAVEFRSRLFGFVDDAEFVIDDQKKVIRFRSAARVGRSDLGMNGKRIEAIRKVFTRGD